MSETTDREITAALRQFADWIYEAIDAACTDADSDDYIGETLEGNDYEFLVDGTRFRH